MISSITYSCGSKTMRNSSKSLVRSISSNESNTIKITFLRHGQSTWNKENIFIGMTDTPLTKEGEVEAQSAGKMLANHKMDFDLVYTSLLKRSTYTAWLALNELDLHWIPVVKDWRLNERNYGALVGRNKKECVEQYGKDQIKRWRRSWDEPPPAMSSESKYWPYSDPRYKKLGILENEIPKSESLKDVTVRTSLFWDNVIIPQLHLKKSILIVGHENNLRSIIKRLDSISNEDIIEIELPRAVPLVYELDSITMKPIKLEGSAKGLSGKYLQNADELAKTAAHDYNLVYGNNVSTKPLITTSYAEKVELRNILIPPSPSYINNYMYKSLITNKTMGDKAKSSIQ